MNSEGAYKIRPAGRHLLTIGRDLIKDHSAAIVELVKNAYDADSSEVNIEFLAKPDNNKFSIVVSDRGHGMSRDTVINKWMVPSTPDKQKRRQSPSGRIMQGRKGIGRYATSILGSELFLETVTPEGEKTTALIEWGAFEKAEYLDDVEILIETFHVSEPSGTKLTMIGGSEYKWSKNEFEKLQSELKKLISPVSEVINDGHKDKFDIRLKIENYPGVPDIAETIKSYPIFDLFDYRITGRIEENGKGTLTYSLQKARNTTEEDILFENGQTGCGVLVFDIRVYDRESKAIDALIKRGLRDDESGEYLGRLETKRLLNKHNGIGVYRNGFRIRPLGDAEFDWLKLNKRRVQNPSLRIGSDQAIGYVQIESEEKSGLVEKSARDGLRENEVFSQLKNITEKVIAKLEERRFEYRQKAGLGRPTLKVEQRVDHLFSPDTLKKSIRLELSKGGISKKVINETMNIINQDTEERNKMAHEIRQIVAIYQGQATLGKIINVVLHEGRRPLNYFRNQIPNLRHWYNAFLKTGDTEKLEKFMPIAEGIGKNADIFVNFFSKLDPLAAGKRPPKKPLNLKKEIHGSLSVFNKITKMHNIRVEIDGPDDFTFSSWQQDIYVIFTNLIDNSIYWMEEKKISKREITLEIVTDHDSLLHIDYRDTGPGIESSLIERDVIFDPEFSTKPSGIGLGLAIAGEAAIRNDLELKAFESDDGAWFRLQPKMMEDQ